MSVTVNLPQTFNLSTTVALSRKYVIEQFIESQPTFTWQASIGLQIEKIVNYVGETIEKICYLQERAPEKLDAHIVKVITAAVFGLITLSLFFTAVGALFTTLSVDPSFLFEGMVSFLVSYVGGYATLQLIRDLDGSIRYDVMIEENCELLFSASV